ncbi:immunoglobulin lambda-1 light chain-like [Gadus chalcogrammus]|uniref:immunoglobulin lambda-1 light chain-like n=1 Tax=Gadus chalcogrammus TaxID=1042646 RepID=UPI0024C37F52|nr:immunoglobulin lambda-1 light chain-like [Gadus chalcogrammus]
MLGTLCSLLAALTCVSAVTVLTQPSVVTLTRGETASIDCNMPSVTRYSARWYKQIPGGVPQFVLHFYQTWTDAKYGSGFSAPHFTSTSQTVSDYRLIINNVEEGDSAVYHCTTWDNSTRANVSQWVFGGGTKLIVTGSSLPPPVLTFYRPSPNPLSSSHAALVCLARQMSIGFAEVSWLVNGSPVTEGTWTSTAVQHPDKTFQLSSYLSLPGCDSEDRSYTCKVTVGSSSFEKTMKMSECSNTLE